MRNFRLFLRDVFLLASRAVFWMAPYISRGLRETAYTLLCGVHLLLRGWRVVERELFCWIVRGIIRTQPPRLRAARRRPRQRRRKLRLRPEASAEDVA